MTPYILGRGRNFYIRLTFISAPKTVAAGPSEILVTTYRTIRIPWFHIPENQHNLQGNLTYLNYSKCVYEHGDAKTKFCKEYHGLRKRRM